MRPTKARTIGCIPPCSRFKPLPESDDEENGTNNMITIELDMLEAMRLVDLEGLDQEEAALRMDVSKPTLCRILAKGRRLIAQALTTGTTIKIEGGNIMFNDSMKEEKQHRFGRRHGKMHGECGSQEKGMGQKHCGKGQCEKHEHDHDQTETCE